MDWTQAITIIASLGAFTFWLFTKLDNDIKSLSTRLDTQSQRLDAQSQRTDKLYQMFVDLLKQKGN
jgi:hypothetical protein